MRPAGRSTDQRQDTHSNARGDAVRVLTLHEEIEALTGFRIYFCDPHSPWQRGTNENTNSLLRQYFPKGPDLSIHTAQDLRDFALQPNHRPASRSATRAPPRP